MKLSPNTQRTHFITNIYLIQKTVRRVAMYYTLQNSLSGLIYFSYSLVCASALYSVGLVDLVEAHLENRMAPRFLFRKGKSIVITIFK